MRFFCDENILAGTVEWLKGQGHDVQSVMGRGMEGVSDEDVLSYATSSNRILLTFNEDFADLRELASCAHSGIIRLRFKIQTEEEIHPMLEKAFLEIANKELTGILVTIRKDKIRIRKAQRQ